MAEEINLNDEDELEEDTEVIETDKETSKHNKKKWYKSAWFWIIFVAIIALASALIWFISVYRPAQAERQERTNAERDVALYWAEIVEKAEDFSAKTANAESVDDFDDLSKEVDKVLDAVSSAEEDFKGVEAISNGAYQEALESLTSYLLSLQAILDKDYEEMTSEDFTSVKTLADESKESVTKFQDETDYVDENLSSDFFGTYADAQKLYDTKVEADKKADEEAKQAEEEAKEALALEEKLVTEAVDGFTDAFIDGDLTRIKKYMTKSFQEEFDFESRQDDLYVPVSYRTIDKTKDNDTRYYVYGRMTQKLADGEDQYSYDYNFTVVKDGERWLVDLDQAPSR